MDVTGADASLERMRPLAWGLLLVLVDLRIGWLDVLPDPAGWFVALLALVPLVSRHRGFAVATAGCSVGLLVSLPDWLEPGLTWVGLATTVTETVVVVGTCTALMALLPARRAGVATIRAWDLGLSVVALAFGALAAGGGGIPDLLVVVLVVAALVVMAAFLVLLFRVADDARKIGPQPA